MMRGAGADDGRLSFFTAELERDEGWADAVDGCDYVIHVASPIPAAAPRTEDELIVPARDGVLRVLRAARDAKVKRVVLTSSCGAIYYGHPPQTAPFDETSWTRLDGEMSAYVRSKAIAERAAWDFMAAEGGALELSAINPTGIFGPVLGKDASSSIELVTRLLKGMPGCPRLYFGVVDVRDVAELHLRAMTHPAAKGERFIASSGDIMSLLVDRARAQGAPRRRGKEDADAGTSELARTVRRAVRSQAASTGAAARQHAQSHERESTAPARLAARPPEDAIVATAESLIAFGVVPGLIARLLAGSWKEASSRKRRLRYGYSEVVSRAGATARCAGRSCVWIVRRSPGEMLLPRRRFQDLRASTVTSKARAIEKSVSPRFTR